MPFARIFIISSTTLFTVRTFFVLFGKKTDLKTVSHHVFIASCLDICSFFATKQDIFAAFLALIVLRAGFLALKSRKKENDGQLEVIVDHLMMSMRSGTSLELALRELSNPHKFQISFFSSHRTYGQILRYCRENPSQSYNLLSCFRRTLRLHNKLSAKHRMLTLQSKAQATISLALFVVIFLFQYLEVPDFLNFLRSPFGRVAISTAVLLLFLGVRWIFKLGQPVEFQL